MPRTPLEKARLGWCLYDWANSAFATIILAAVLPVYFAAQVPTGGASLSLFGLQRNLPASALWGYAVALSMALVAIAAPWLGAHADRQGRRRQWFVMFGLGGAAATVFLAMVPLANYLLTATVFILANLCFASGNIFYNAFLPALAQGKELDRLSSRGYALGYLGGGLALLLVFILIQGYDQLGFSDRGAATRAGFMVTGLWWGLFAVPAFYYLREDFFISGPVRSLAGFNGYLQTFGEIRRHKDLLLFLLAFLFFNDGIQTVIAVSAIFAKEELGLSQTTILEVFLMIQFVAMPGSLLFGRAAARFGSKESLLGGLLLFIGITVYAYFMQHSWEFWLLGFLVALIFGGLQAISRSLYASLIPPGKNAEFYGFYAISGKFSSIFGPLLFAAIAHLTGSARLSILALSILFIAGIVLLVRVDMVRGQAFAHSELP